jgi:hypothetical protein
MQHEADFHFSNSFSARVSALLESFFGKWGGVLPISSDLF